MGRPLPDETTGGGDAALAALESAMGAVAVKDEQFDGEIAEDDEESGRQAVVYDADALFDDEDASASAVSAEPKARGYSPRGDADSRKASQAPGDSPPPPPPQWPTYLAANSKAASNSLWYRLPTASLLCTASDATEASSP